MLFSYVPFFPILINKIKNSYVGLNLNLDKTEFSILIKMMPSAREISHWAIMILNRNTKVKVRSPDGDTEYFDIVAGVLQGDSLSSV